jgi:hypothetical protein
MKGKRTNRAHCLRSVQQREALFHFSLQRRDLRAFECYRGC